MKTKQSSKVKVILLGSNQDLLNSIFLTLQPDVLSGIHRCISVGEVVELLRDGSTALLFADLIRFDPEKTAMMETLFSKFPHLHWLGITDGGLKANQYCFQNGAIDILETTYDRLKVLSVFRKAMEICELRTMVSRLGRNDISTELEEVRDSFVCESPKTIEAFKHLLAFSHVSDPLLICGEAGSGKETFAKLLHKFGRYQGKYIYRFTWRTTLGMN